MNPALWIWFWSGLFVITHLAISSTLLRPRLLAALGAQPYRGIYSLIALGTLLPMIVTFSLHEHSGPLLWYLRDNRPLRTLALLLMLFAFIFLVGSFVNPPPSAMGGGSPSARPHRILKLTRHPSFVAFSLFGFAHLLMNGWLGDVGFFGSFAVLGVLGGLHQDSRKVRELGASYVELMRATSFFPGAAIISGRQEFRASDIPWLAIGLGAALTVLIALLHPMLFGGRPLA